ncbi:hypothetical protein BD779DRAFT_1565863 [Infundibulicybe gibba]|nr:hypothetical protein BD779DRAFT_1565863 [Infundibulicybe gibba]
MNHCVCMPRSNDADKVDIEWVGYRSSGQGTRQVKGWAKYDDAGVAEFRVIFEGRFSSDEIIETKAAVGCCLCFLLARNCWMLNAGCWTIAYVLNVRVEMPPPDLSRGGGRMSVSTSVRAMECGGRLRNMRMGDVACARRTSRIRVCTPDLNTNVRRSTGLCGEPSRGTTRQRCLKEDIPYEKIALIGMVIPRR